MIVLSRALALALADTVDARLPVMLWDTVLTPETVEADGEADGYPAANLTNPSTYERWIGIDTEEQHITFTLGGVPVDAIGIARHNFGSGNIVVSVEAHEGDEEWHEVLEEFVPADDRPLLLRFEVQYADQVRIRLQPVSAVPTAAVAMAGMLMAFPRGIRGPHTPLNVARDTQVVNGMSESGNFLGRVITGQSKHTDVRIEHIEEPWYYQHFEPFMQQGVGTPFFFAWYPEQRPDDVGYAWLRDDVRPSQAEATLRFSITMPIGGIA